MNEETLKRKTIAQLRSMAKELSLRTRTTMKKVEIIKLILKKTSEEQDPKEKLRPVAPVPLAQTLPSLDRYADLPSGYGKNRIIAMARDPAWIYTYWEVTPEGLAEGCRLLHDEGARLTLRVYDVSGSGEFSRLHDIEIYHRISNWYIEAGQGGKTFVVDVGMKSWRGDFVMLAQSNPAVTPPGQVSDDLSEEWWLVEDGERTTRFSSDAGQGVPEESLLRKAEGDWSSIMFEARLKIKS